MEKIKIGKIVKAVGTKGEVKIYNYSDKLDNYKEGNSIIVERESKTIERSRIQKNMIIVKLKGVDTRNEAEDLKEKNVYIRESELKELPKDTYYLKDLIGLDIVDQDDNKKIGKLNNIIQNSSQDIYEILCNNDKVVLVPAVKEFVKEIDFEKRSIFIKFLEGMK